jgi:uncharacterized protein (TIGR02246 family)
MNMFIAIGNSPAHTPVRWALAATLALLVFAIAAQAADKKADENTIRSAIQSYVDAFNRGDAKAVADCWGESAEWISPSGQRFQGREAIRKEMEQLFAEQKGVHIEVLHPSIRIVSSDAAIEEGTARVIRPGEAPSDSTYLAVHVKKDGHWKLDSVHETEAADVPAAGSPLQDLAWLVGEWTDAEGDAAVETRISWTKNQSFLNYSFKVSVPGEDELEGTQVIGWDPAAGTIRSWMFDSDGGFGEGVWSKKDNSWVVKFTQVLPDSRKASATNIYTPVDDNTITWKSIGRSVDGQFLPNIEEVKIVRKAASKTKEVGKPADKARKSKAKK